LQVTGLAQLLYLGFDSWQGKDIFLFETSGLALGPKKPPIHGVSGTLAARVKRPEHEADHSTPFNAEDKNDQC